MFVYVVKDITKHCLLFLRFIANPIILVFSSLLLFLIFLLAAGCQTTIWEAFFLHRILVVVIVGRLSSSYFAFSLIAVDVNAFCGMCEIFLTSFSRFVKLKMSHHLTELTNSPQAVSEPIVLCYNTQKNVKRGEMYHKTSEIMIARISTKKNITI